MMNGLTHASPGREVSPRPPQPRSADRNVPNHKPVPGDGGLGEASLPDMHSRATMAETGGHA